MKREMSVDEATLKAEAYCVQCERCNSEMKAKLIQWGQTESVIEDILQHLSRMRYLDERRYAHAFANDKFRFNVWGKFKIKQALMAKNINEALIDDALSDIDMNAYLQTLKTLLRDKVHSLKVGTKEAKAKACRFALGRGFEWNDIIRCMDMDDALTDADEFVE